MACLLHSPLSTPLSNTQPSFKTRSRSSCGNGICEASIIGTVDESSIVTRRRSEKFAGPCSYSNSNSKNKISKTFGVNYSEFVNTFDPSYFQLKDQLSSPSNTLSSSVMESTFCSIRVQFPNRGLNASACMFYGVIRLSDFQKKKKTKINFRSTIRGIFLSPYRSLPSTQPLSVRALLDASGFGDNLKSRSSHDLRSVGKSAYCAFGKAFSSMVFIVRSLQSYAIHMRSVLLCEKDIHELLNSVHKEMHSSFLWLFQQIFARTPTLMIAVMLLFSDFTVHSLGQNLSPVQYVLFDQIKPLIDYYSSQSYSDKYSVLTYSERTIPLRETDFFMPSGEGNGIGGNGTRKSFHHSDSYDNEDSSRGWSQRGLFHLKDWTSQPSTSMPLFSSPNPSSVSLKETEARSSQPVEETNALQSLLEKTAKEMELKEGQPLTHLQLDQETIRLLVAPIRVQMETDDYTCFDRTDLQYQHAISSEPGNPMLLANYAQFLYVVRRDFDSAEEMFHRAMTADPTDGDVLARFASFLWLGRGDKTAAERAYRAAIASDPCNPYYNGSYAHFLWHAGDDDISCPIP